MRRRITSLESAALRLMAIGRHALAARAIARALALRALLGAESAGYETGRFYK